MLATSWIGLLALLLRGVFCADFVVKSKYNDPDTGLTFSWSYVEYVLGTSYFSFRTAQSPDAQNGDDFEAIIQVVAPNSIGWLGLAFDGTMQYNPLMVTWKGPTTAQPAVISSRWAEGHITPRAYPNANYTIFKTGTKSNNTHWQVTARCRGCASWIQKSGQRKTINPRSTSIKMGWAYSNQKPSQPANVNSQLPVHGTPNYFNHDWASGSNTNYNTIVQKLQVL